MEAIEKKLAGIDIRAELEQLKVKVADLQRRIADLVLPKSSSLADLDTNQLSAALGIRTDTLLAEDDQ